MKLNNLEKKVSTYWLLTRVILALIVIVAFIFGIYYVPNEFLLILVIPGGVVVLISFIYSIIFPFLEQRLYKYGYDGEKLVISKGVIFRRYVVIPIIQIQDISMFEGPLQMLFKIANISISTAGSNNNIISLNKVVAKDLVNEIQTKIHERINKIIEGNINETL